MPLNLTPAPGGGTSIAQGLKQGLDSRAKDKLALESLQVPGVRESMGDEAFNFITQKGPGAHKRLGAYMQQADKLSGGRVSATNAIVQNVSRRLEGRKDVPRDEVLSISLQEAQTWNQQNPDKPQFTQPEIEKTFNMMIPKGKSAARPTAKTGGRSSKEEKPLTSVDLNKEVDKQFSAQLKDLEEGEGDPSREATVSFIASDEFLRAAVRFDEKGKVEGVSRARLKQAWRNKLEAERGFPGGTPKGMIKVVVTAGENKGRPATVPEADFDPKTMKRR